MPKSPEGYQPSAEEMAKAEGMMTEKQEWSSEQREKQLEQLDAFVEAVKNEPHIYESLMDGNRSAKLVRVIAENLKTKDGLIFLTTEDLRVFRNRIVKDPSDVHGHTVKAGPEDVKLEQQGNIRIWQEKPEGDETGHFDKGTNPNLVANAYANVEDIRQELQELLKHMDVVAEEDHSPKKYDWYVGKSKLYVLKKKEHLEG